MTAVPPVTSNVAPPVCPQPAAFSAAKLIRTSPGTGAGFRSGLRHRRKHEIFHFGFAFIGIDLNRKRVSAVSCRRRELGRSGAERIAREVEPANALLQPTWSRTTTLPRPVPGQFIAQVRRQNDRFERLAVPVGAVQRQHAGVDLQFGAFGFAPSRPPFPPRNRSQAPPVRRRSRASTQEAP